jgi:ornithine cyclodeaminase/alanine dehydrogenase-like protein (mu-crystallin family)
MGMGKTHTQEDSMADLRTIDAYTVCRKLTYDVAISAVRRAMIALSTGKVHQLLRSFIPVKDRHIFALMPAADNDIGYFGAKLVSVFADRAGQMQHAGYILLFEEKSGLPVCLADAEEISRIRTAAASAIATDALALPGADTMAVLGCGKQAAAHIEAIALVRALRTVRVWGRNADKAKAFARAMADRTGLPVEAAGTARDAAKGADIVCTVTSASTPVLEGKWVMPGAHVNAVGSSTPGPVEIDQNLVVKSRFIADHREHVLQHGAEFLRARTAGAISDDHIVAEIGEVLAGSKPGRTATDEITLYKSLGHAVQDIAAAAWLYEHA